jgi:hypothetical protein
VQFVAIPYLGKRITADSVAGWLNNRKGNGTGQGGVYCITTIY